MFPELEVDSPETSVDERCCSEPANVLPAPSALLQRVEDLSVEELVAQLGVEAFPVAALPGTAGFDIECLCARIGEPLAQVTSQNSGHGLWNSRAASGCLLLAVELPAMSGFSASSRCC